MPRPTAAATPPAGGELEGADLAAGLRVAEGAGGELEGAELVAGLRIAEEAAAALADSIRQGRAKLALTTGAEAPPGCGRMGRAASRPR